MYFYYIGNNSNAMSFNGSKVIRLRLSRPKMIRGCDMIKNVSIGQLTMKTFKYK